MNTVMKLLLA